MKAEELTYGIEIETTYNESDAELIGLTPGPKYEGDVVDLPAFGEGWQAQCDNSIEYLTGYIPCEFSSPVFHGVEPLYKIPEIIEWLRGSCSINQSCGIHIHVGWHRNWPSEKLAKLVAEVAHAECAIFAMTGTHYREESEYCKSLRQYQTLDEAETAILDDRRHILNLENLAFRRRSTVEFRAFPASLDAGRIIAWIQVCLGLVEFALDEGPLPPWPEENSSEEYGLGEKEVRRLLHRLGWLGRGERKRYGWLGGPLSLNEATHLLISLARNYDRPGRHTNGRRKWLAYHPMYSN